MSYTNLNTEEPKLYCIHFNECDRKKCTAIKLNRLKLLKIIIKIRGNLNKAIILNPFSNINISLDDRTRISKYGLIVIDCSWKKIMNLNKFHIENSRKLPPLLAVNPTNFGKWEKLSSAEALAAALYITGFQERADLLLSKFSWGEQFKKLNEI